MFIAVLQKHNVSSQYVAMLSGSVENTLHLTTATCVASCVFFKWGIACVWQCVGTQHVNDMLRWHALFSGDTMLRTQRSSSSCASVR